MFRLVSTAAFLLVTVPALASRVTHLCPNDWVYFDDYCYAFLDVITPWSTAVEMCRQLDSSLLVITNQRENNFIAAQLIARYGSNGYFWMNINDLVREGHWVQGDNQPLSFTYWAADQPNDSKWYENGEDCAVIQSPGTWHDLWCENHPRSTAVPRPVCKKNVTSTY